MEHAKHEKEFKKGDMHEMGKINELQKVDSAKKWYPSVRIDSKTVPEIAEMGVGDEITIHAHCKVTSLSETDDGKEGNIEIERMGIKEGHNPFKSKSQQRLFYAAAGGSKKWRKGKKPEISQTQAEEYAEDTNFKNLPERMANKTSGRTQMKRIRGR